MALRRGLLLLLFKANLETLDNGVKTMRSIEKIKAMVEAGKLDKLTKAELIALNQHNQDALEQAQKANASKASEKISPFEAISKSIDDLTVPRESIADNRGGSPGQKKSPMRLDGDNVAFWTVDGHNAAILCASIFETTRKDRTGVPVVSEHSTAGILTAVQRDNEAGESALCPLPTRNGLKRLPLAVQPRAEKGAEIQVEASGSDVRRFARAIALIGRFWEIDLDTLIETTCNTLREGYADDGIKLIPVTDTAEPFVSTKNSKRIVVNYV